MNGLLMYLVMFASASVVLQSIVALDAISWRTHHGIRLAFLGLTCSAFYALLDCLYQRAIPVSALVGVLLAVSVLLAVDRRGRDRHRGAR